MAVDDAPRIPTRPKGERQPLLPSQRPAAVEPEPDSGDDDPTARPHFEVRRPTSDIAIRWVVVSLPVALAVIAGLLGAHFQEARATYRRGGVPELGGYLRTTRQLLAYMSAVGVEGLAALALWSGLMVTNTCRVCRSLRTPWFGAVGWLIAPALGIAAHLSLDKRLNAGSLIGFTVFLAALYLPFGTLGGAASDLGGSPHLARVWFLASVVGAFLLIVGVSGSTRSLPTSNPQDLLRIRAIACYLAAMMLLASSALALATARNLGSLISHRWEREFDPEGVLAKADRIKTRSSRGRRSPIPNLFLRVLVTALLVLTALASVSALFWFRGRAIQLSAKTDSLERGQLLDRFRTLILQIGVVAVAFHAVYVLWAIVAAINARRRSITAPPPIAVVSAFLLGPIVAVIGWAIGREFGAAVFVVGLVMTIGGFVVGQLVLGRTVSMLGQRGRIFLGWLVSDFGAVLIGAFVSHFGTTRIQLVSLGVLQIGFAFVGAAMAWTAMTRLDRACRANDSIVLAGPGQAPTSLAFTSSHS